MVVVVDSVEELGVDPATDEDTLLELLDDELEDELLELLDELDEELLELLDDELLDDELEELVDEVSSAGHVPESWKVTSVVVLLSSPTVATAYALSSSHPAGVLT